MVTDRRPITGGSTEREYLLEVHPPDPGTHTSPSLSMPAPQPSSNPNQAIHGTPGSKDYFKNPLLDPKTFEDQKSLGFLSLGKSTHKSFEIIAKWEECT